MSFEMRVNHRQSDWPGWPFYTKEVRDEKEHKMSLLTQWFCDEVKKRTNDKIEITHHLWVVYLAATFCNWDRIGLCHVPGRICRFCLP